MTKEDRRDLARVVIQKVGIDMADMCDLWLITRSDYEPIFSIPDRLHRIFRGVDSVIVDTRVPL